SVMDVAVSEITLFLRQPHELLDAFREVGGWGSPRRNRHGWRGRFILRGWHVKNPRTLAPRATVNRSRRKSRGWKSNYLAGHSERRPKRASSRSRLKLLEPSPWSHFLLTPVNYGNMPRQVKQGKSFVGEKFFQMFHARG